MLFLVYNAFLESRCLNHGFITWRCGSDRSNVGPTLFRPCLTVVFGIPKLVILRHDCIAFLLTLILLFFVLIFSGSWMIDCSMITCWQMVSLNPVLKWGSIIIISLFVCRFLQSLWDINLWTVLPGGLLVLNSSLKRGSWENLFFSES